MNPMALFFILITGRKDGRKGIMIEYKIYGEEMDMWKVERIPRKPLWRNQEVFMFMDDGKQHNVDYFR